MPNRGSHTCSEERQIVARLPATFVSDRSREAALQRHNQLLDARSRWVRPSSDGIDLPVPELELPDPSHLRLTTIGGKWPIGRNVGVAYVHQRRLAQADAQASITSAGGLPIEGVAEIAHVSAVDSASGRRFIGFRAKYLRTVSAGVVEVSLYRRGTNATPMPALRLTSADCDASPITLPYPGWRFAPLDPASPPASPQEVDVMVSIPFVLKWSAPYRALLAGPKVPFWLW